MNFTKITSEVTTLIENINSGKGIVPGLLKDSLMAEDLRTSLINMEAASKKLDENLEALKHSFLLRGYFRRLEKSNKKNNK